MSAFEREADLGSPPLECADATRDPSTVCDCEGGEGPNCPGCVEQMSAELAKAVDDTQDTLELARRVIAARYAVPRISADERKAEEALKAQLHSLWRRTVGGSL